METGVGAKGPGTRCLRWGKGGLGSLLRSSILLIHLLVCPRKSKKRDGGDGDDDAKPFDRDVKKGGAAYSTHLTFHPPLSYVPIRSLHESYASCTRLIPWPKNWLSSQRTTPTPSHHPLPQTPRHPQLKHPKCLLPVSAKKLSAAAIGPGPPTNRKNSLLSPSKLSRLGLPLTFTLALIAPNACASNVAIQRARASTLLRKSSALANTLFIQSICAVMIAFTTLPERTYSSARARPMRLTRYCRPPAPRRRPKPVSSWGEARVGAGVADIVLQNLISRAPSTAADLCDEDHRQLREQSHALRDLIRDDRAICGRRG